MTNLMCEANAMCLEFGAVNFWEFAYLRVNLYTLFIEAHPSVNETDKAQSMDSICSLKECCMTRQSTKNIVKFFEADAGRMRKDHEFKDALQLVAKRMRLANFWTERLMAAIQKDCEKGGDIEGVAAKAFLGQLLRLHNAKDDHTDPRFVHRQLLIRDGVKLNRCAEAKPPQKSGAFILFKKHHEAAMAGDREEPRIRRPRCDMRPREDYVTWLNQLGLDWNALPQSEVDRYESEARLQLANKLVENEGGDDNLAPSAAAGPAFAKADDQRYSPLMAELAPKTSHLVGDRFAHCAASYFMLPSILDCS